MKATMTSTSRFVQLYPAEIGARVWEGETDTGIRFTAYVAAINVNAGSDGAALSREIAASAPPSIETETAIERSAREQKKSPPWPLASARDSIPAPSSKGEPETSAPDPDRRRGSDD